MKAINAASRWVRAKWIMRRMDLSTHFPIRSERQQRASVGEEIRPLQRVDFSRHRPIASVHFKITTQDASIASTGASPGRSPLEVDGDDNRRRMASFANRRRLESDNNSEPGESSSF
jgi:hypothetical protein